MKAQILPIKSILPDENQPRKYFDAEKLKALKDSIKKHGIQVPLVVEDLGAGKYLLIDGERRFRAATELHLKEVPAVIEKPTSATERLVKQFNIQEQHESWTPVEKAVALLKLAEEMGVSLPQVCKLLNISPSIADRYVAFSELANMDGYIRSEIPLDYAKHIRWLKKHIREIRHSEGEEMSKAEEKKLEAKIILNIKDGAIVRRMDIMKLKDSFSKNPKMIEEYLEDNKATPSSLFHKSKAKGAYYLRNAVVNASYMRSNAQSFMKTKDVKLTTAQVLVLKEALKSLKELIDTAE